MLKEILKMTKKGHSKRAIPDVNFNVSNLALLYHGVLHKHYSHEFQKVILRCTFTVR
jgi:hypothetical protein